MLREYTTGRTDLVAYVALVTSARLVGRMLDSRVGLELAPRTTNLAAVGAGHAQRRERLGLKLHRSVNQFFVSQKLGLGGEFTALAKLAGVLDWRHQTRTVRRPIVWTLRVVVALVQRIVVARSR